MTNTYYSKLRHFRVKKKLSLHHFAQILQIPTSTLGRYEDNFTSLPAWVLVAYMTVFNISVSDALDGAYDELLSQCIHRCEVLKSRSFLENDQEAPHREVLLTLQAQFQHVYDQRQNQES